jgi:hypothetical protein
LLPLLEKEAKERMAAGGRDKGKQKVADPGQARDKAAKAVHVNRQYVSDAKRLSEKAPELAEAVQAGELTVQGGQARSR